MNDKLLVKGFYFPRCLRLQIVEVKKLSFVAQQQLKNLLALVGLQWCRYLAPSTTSTTAAGPA